MSTNPSEAPDLADVFRAYPHGVPELLAYHDILLRGASDLSVAQRELIAAYVSGINACGFCFGAHSIIASTFGVSEDLIRALVDDLDAAPVEQRLKSLLYYVGKLTRTPARVTEQDRAQVYAAGWSARALHDAVATCALFNFMNRLVEGMGVRTSSAIQAAQRERHGAAPQQNDPSPYMNYGRRIGVVPPLPDVPQPDDT
ncbi:peroxidase-related enzyme [Fontimonas sp. SYSU GA230001]|uniref:carboxymuconolactone decarboxylase family protein n=1 Tax=Fontimonas sp. SYSU GA230001 TaxID=3142450 RepID=UPI0032B5677D